MQLRITHPVYNKVILYAIANRYVKWLVPTCHLIRISNDRRPLLTGPANFPYSTRQVHATFHATQDANQRDGHI